MYVYLQLLYQIKSLINQQYVNSSWIEKEGPHREQLMFDQIANFNNNWKNSFGLYLLSKYVDFLLSSMEHQKFNGRFLTCQFLDRSREGSSSSWGHVKYTTGHVWVMAKHWKYRITSQHANSIDGQTTPEANNVKSISYCTEFTPCLLQKKTNWELSHFCAETQNSLNFAI